MVIPVPSCVIYIFSTNVPLLYWLKTFESRRSRGGILVEIGLIDSILREQLNLH